MAIIGREILAKPILRTKTLSVPEWGGEIIIRELNDIEREKCHTILRKNFDHANGMPDAAALARFRRYVFVYGWVDESGAQVITPQEIDTLAQQSGAVLDRIAGEIARFSGLSPDDEGDGDAAEDAEKN